MFNRQEQLILLFLGVSLLAGSGVALVDHYRPSSMGEFQVRPAALQTPAEQVGPAAPVAAPKERAGPVRLNTADAAQLQQLPGIGPKTAARILSYRQEQGAFKTIEDLARVPGIGARTLEKLRPLVVVE
ncbi:MAG: ComEA family DNA-binding protein [Candidatus Latescibacteria bacterium]|nr:ComEA family DNA-binding protein [Candidatus Latescibacterota bacterium]